MTLRRATLYISGASLLVAWFSSAASISTSRHHEGIAREAEQSFSPIEDMALQVQQQSERLRARQATTPKPQPPLRNPFAFRVMTPRPQASAPPVLAAVATSGPVEPVEPTLRLVGIAEQKQAQGIARTALLVTVGDALIMATVGDPVVQRYKVTAIGPDAVELEDLTAGRTRVLTLDVP